jgi:hypothetical protein
MVESCPERVVAAYVIDLSVQSGMRKVDSQPAPRMSKSTAIPNRGCDVESAVGKVGDVVENVEEAGDQRIEIDEKQTRRG